MSQDVSYTSILLLHGALTLFMVGLIWFVQVVHYPLFGRLRGLGIEAFESYSSEHQRRTSWVVIAPMLGEAATAALLVFFAPASERLLVWVGLALLAMVWLSTFLLQVPRHARLLGGYDEATVRGLVATNWIRTAAWTARGVVCLMLLARVIDQA